MNKKKRSLDFHRIRTYPLRERQSKVKISDSQCCLPKTGIGFLPFFEALSHFSAGSRLKQIVQAIITSAKSSRPVLFCLQAGVLESVLGPLLISLMERKIVTGIAITGAGGIADFEIALIGQTGEDEASGLEDGTLGMVEETAKLMNETIIQGAKQGLGAGQALGEKILRDDFPYRDYSVLARGIEYGIPVTLHMAIGADVIQQHPSTDGAAIGEASYIDFQMFANQISLLGKGGVIVNIGSDPLLNQVFIKALTIARNLGHRVKDFSLVDIDTAGPKKTELSRPENIGGQIYTITAEQEIVVPFLVQAVMDLWQE